MSEPVSIVVCQSCRREYKAYLFGENQADGCAAELSEDYIKGGYGSYLVDMETWTFAKERPAWANTGTICDTCIQRLMDENLIERYDGDPTLSNGFFLTIGDDILPRVQEAASKRGMSVTAYVNMVLAEDLLTSEEPPSE